MRKIEKASSVFNIDLNTYIENVVDNRSQPFKAYLSIYKPTWKTESNNLVTQHLIGDIVDTNSLTDVQAQSKGFKGLYTRCVDERSFIARLRDNHKSKICPYCGSPGCGTLDHYYPQTKFPQFSIIPDNLIPCCYRCNKIKDEEAPIVKTKRVIHPYFDKFLSNIIYELEFCIVSGTLLFKILPHRKLKPDHKAIVKYHIERLLIKTYHTESILSTFDSEKDNIKHLIAYGMDDIEIRKQLNRCVSSGLKKGRTYDWGLIVKNSIVINANNYKLIKDMA